MRAIVERAADEIRGEARSARRRGDGRAASSAIVEGDDVLLRQAFSNLCRNALEACVDASVPPRIAIEGSVDRGAAACSVIA